MSSPESASPSAAGSSPPHEVSPEKPTGNKFDQMFNSDTDSNHDDDDDADDAGPKKASRGINLGGDAAGDEDAEGEEDEELDADKDLFGDDSDEEQQPVAKELDDRELDVTPEVDHDKPEKIYRSIDVSLPRHQVPDAGEDDLYIMRIPHNTSVTLKPQVFHPEAFTLPIAPADSAISPYTLATNSIRVRKSPVDSTQLQSNTRVVRWSDGSLSLQIASSPTFYDLPQVPLAPSHGNRAYDATQDSHTYLLTPHLSAGMLRVTGHVTKSLGILPASTSLMNDAAVSKLSQGLTAAIESRGGRRGGGKTIEITSMVDPEAERKEAERLDREKQRSLKKLENSRRKGNGRDGSGGGIGGRGGLDEDGSRRPKYNPRSAHTRSKRDSPPITKGPGRTKEDEYDLEDDFVEGSDDEPEELEDSEESDDGRRKKSKPAKKRKEEEVVEEEEEEEDEEEEAEFTDDERPTAKASQGGRGKRRRVVVDEEDDE